MENSRDVSDKGLYIEGSPGAREGTLRAIPFKIRPVFSGRKKDPILRSKWFEVLGVLIHAKLKVGERRGRAVGRGDLRSFADVLDSRH